MTEGEPAVAAAEGSAEQKHALQEAHRLARGVLDLGLSPDFVGRVAEGSGWELVVRGALRLLAAQGYVGPGRTVLEWAVDRAETGAGTKDDWHVAAFLAHDYLSRDSDASSLFARLAEINDQAVRCVNERHLLTSVDPWRGGGS